MAGMTNTIVKLRKQLEWARKIREDEAQPTNTLQLADAVIAMTEDAIETEKLRLEQLDRVSPTELGLPQ